MMKKITWCLLAGCGLLLNAAAEPVNMLADGSLENWKQQTEPAKGLELKDQLTLDLGRTGGIRNERESNPATLVERDATVKHGGEYSIKITNRTHDAIPVVSIFDIPVTGNTKYRFSCWIKGAGVDRTNAHGIYGGFTAGSHATFWSDNQGQIKTEDWAGDWDWRKFETEVVTHPTDQQAMVQIQLRNATGTIWVDDLELVKVEE